MYTSQDRAQLRELGLNIPLLDEIDALEHSLETKQQELDRLLRGITKVLISRHAQPTEQPEEVGEEEVTPIRSKKDFHVTRSAARLVADAAIRNDLPELDYEHGAPSTFVEAMEFLMGTPQWEHQVINFKGEQVPANYPEIRHWLESSIPRVVEIMVNAWAGNKPKDNHVASSANKVPASRREYVRRLGLAFTPVPEHVAKGLPNPDTHEKELEAAQPK